MTALMDPTKKSSGFYRSMVGRAAMHADEVARGATGVTSSVGETTTPAPPTPPPGPTVTAVTVDGVPTIGSPLRVTLALDKAGPKPVPGLGIGIRWDPISLDPPPVIPAAPGAAPSATPGSPSDTPGSPSDTPASQSATPDAPFATPDPPSATSAAPSATPAAPSPSPSAAPAAPAASATAPAGGAPAGPSPRPSAEAVPTEASATPGAEIDAVPSAPPIVLISPEVQGTVVSLSDVSVTKSGISAEVVTPLEPGLYRLVVSIHDRDGVAFGAPTQERIPALIVRVTGELSAVISATDRLSVAAGATVDLPVSVANTGHLAWVSGEPWQSIASPVTLPALGEWYPALVGQWMRPDGSAAGSETVAARATTYPSPGATEDVVLPLTAPLEPGTYLLLLDVVSPAYGSLTAVGGSPVVVRVEVTPPESGGARGIDPAGGPATSR
jgi:hypothetical protein